MSKPPIGSIVSADITSKHADQLRDFYSQVVGWKPQKFEMDGYSDYMMQSPTTDQPVAGVCHAKGPNADLPHQWIVYVNVESIETSLKSCVEHGGSVVKQTDNYALIKDPTGAVMALVQMQ